MLSFATRFVEMTVTAWVIIERTDSPLAVTLAGFFRYLPFLIAGPFVGLLADRFPRMRIVRASEIGMGLASAIIALLAFTDSIAVWHIYLYVMASGALWTMAMPARRAYMASVVGRRNLTPALAIDMLGWTVSNIIASNTAGGLLRVVAPQWIYLWLTLAACISLYLLRGLPLMWVARSTTDREPALQSIALGFKYVAGQRYLVGAVAVVALTNFTGFIFELMTPVFAEEVLHTESAGLGLLISAPAFGALITGTILTLYGRRMSRPGLWLMVAATAQHALTILWTLTDWFPLSFAILVVTGLFTFLFGTMNSNTFLVATPDNMRGRVQGVQIFVIGAFPLSGLVVGALANAIGPADAVMWMAIGGSVVLAGLWFAFPDLLKRVGSDVRH